MPVAKYNAGWYDEIKVHAGMAEKRKKQDSNSKGNQVE